MGDLGMYIRDGRVIMYFGEFNGDKFIWGMLVNVGCSLSIVYVLSGDFGGVGVCKGGCFGCVEVLG